MRHLRAAFAALFIIAIALCASCGGDDSQPADAVARQAQALGTINYALAGVRVARNAATARWTSPFIGGGGGFADRVFALSMGQISARIDYQAVAQLTPAGTCNGTFTHDTLAVLRFGVAASVPVAARAGYHAYWLVAQEPGQDLAPECNLSDPSNYGFPLCGNLADPTICTDLSLPADSVAILGSNGTGMRDCPVGDTTASGCGESIQLVHEWLHGQPTLAPANDVAGFLATHDGSISCSGANPTWSATNPSCTVNTSTAGLNYLGASRCVDPTCLLHHDAMSETVENKRLDAFHVGRARSAAYFRQLLPLNPPPGSAYAQTIVAHDVPSYNAPIPDYYEVSVPRADGRTIYFEFRQHMWTGCTNANPALCGQADTPGVYAWVVQVDGTKQLLALCSGSPSFWNGFCPIAQIAGIENFTAVVSNKTATSATLQINF